ncbi:MAG: hypothetical protein O3A47_11715 [Chloroflexi bacterium]|nr:hypothetical protein [Chloroflexota bacterium]
MAETRSLTAYLSSIEKDAASGVTTEHTYRPALKTFLESLEQGITATDEPKRIECGVPDFTVSRQTGHGPSTLGYGAGQGPRQRPGCHRA